MGRRNLVVIVLLGALACRSHQVSWLPEPVPGPVTAVRDSVPPPAAVSAGDSVVADNVPADTVVTPEQIDSAADQQALNALEEMEADSGGLGAKGTEGVREKDVAREAADMFAAGRGGAASAAGPTYDIDVTSFADHKTVKLYMGFFQRLARERFEIWLGRLARYEPMVRQRFAQQGIPE